MIFFTAFQNRFQNLVMNVLATRHENV